MNLGQVRNPGANAQAISALPTSTFTGNKFSQEGASGEGASGQRENKSSQGNLIQEYSI